MPLQSKERLLGPPSTIVLSVVTAAPVPMATEYETPLPSWVLAPMTTLLFPATVVVAAACAPMATFLVPLLNALSAPTPIAKLYEPVVTLLFIALAPMATLLFTLVPSATPASSPNAWFFIAATVLVLKKSVYSTPSALVPNL
jgi:hypothetical protein